MTTEEFVRAVFSDQYERWHVESLHEEYGFPFRSWHDFTAAVARHGARARIDPHTYLNEIVELVWWFGKRDQSKYTFLASVPLYVTGCFVLLAFVTSHYSLLWWLFAAPAAYFLGQLLGAAYSLRGWGRWAWAATALALAAWLLHAAVHQNIAGAAICAWLGFFWAAPVAQREYKRLRLTRLTLENEALLYLLYYCGRLAIVANHEVYKRPPTPTLTYPDGSSPMPAEWVL